MMGSEQFCPGILLVLSTLDADTKLVPTISLSSQLPLEKVSNPNVHYTVFNVPEKRARFPVLKAEKPPSQIFPICLPK